MCKTGNRKTKSIVRSKQEYQKENAATNNKGNQHRQVRHTHAPLLRLTHDKFLQANHDRQAFERRVQQA